MNEETEKLSDPGHENLRAKLRNSISDLRWYGFRICQLNGIQGVSPKNSLERIDELFECQRLPEDLLSIWAWCGKIQDATPQTADQLFYDCWKFLHNSFDEKLRK